MTMVSLPQDSTNFAALEEGFVSITPLQLDLTACPAMHLLNTLSWKLVEEPDCSGIFSKKYPTGDLRSTDVGDEDAASLINHH